MIVRRTERANIRRIEVSDFDFMMKVYSDLELMKFVGDSAAITEADCRRWIEITHRNYETRGYGLFVVEQANSGHSIGFIGLTHPEDIPYPEVKYTLRKEFWGLGLATELVTALTKHAFESKWTTLIVATVHPENAASGRVLLKSGYVRKEDIRNEDGSLTAYYVCESNVRSDL